MMATVSRAYIPYSLPAYSRRSARIRDDSPMQENSKHHRGHCLAANTHHPTRSSSNTRMGRLAWKIQVDSFFFASPLQIFNGEVFFCRRNSTLVERRVICSPGGANHPQA